MEILLWDVWFWPFKTGFLHNRGSLQDRSVCSMYVLKLPKESCNLTFFLGACIVQTKINFISCIFASLQYR